MIALLSRRVRFSHSKACRFFNSVVLSTPKAVHVFTGVPLASSRFVKEVDPVDFHACVYCTLQTMNSGDTNLSVTWPVNNVVSTGANNRNPWSSLNDSFRVLVAGKQSYAQNVQQWY